MLQRLIAILLALTLGVTATIAAAPTVSAQIVTETVTGTISAGGVPLAGVTVGNLYGDVLSDPDGEFSMESELIVDDVLIQAVQSAQHPEFFAEGTADFAATPVEIELAPIRQVEFIVQGGVYTDCSYDAAIVEGCVIDDMCTPELAIAGLCDEVFIEIHNDLDHGDVAGRWSSVGDTVDNSIVLPVFDQPGFRIFAATIDAGVVEFNWDGSSSMILDLDDPYVGYTWFPDVDGDGFGDPDGTPINNPGLPGAGYTLDNTDCDDLRSDFYPGAPERPASGFDEDCDGIDADPVSITGRVLAGDVPLAGVSVFSNFHPFNELITEADGTFTFDVAPNGPLVGEFFLEGPEGSTIYPYFSAPVMIDGLTTDADFDIVLPEVAQVEVRVNDPSLPGHIPDAGEARVRVLDNLIGPNLDSGANWASQAFTTNGVASVPVFIGASAPEYPGTFFFGAQGVDDEALVGGAPFTGDSPIFITLVAPPYTWYRDLDGDFFGDTNGETIVSEAWPGPGYEGLAGDCDDSDPAINPLADEIPDNGIDEDCDGLGGPIDPPPNAPQLEIRFDIVRENGEVCTADFASATPGVGEPLMVDDGEEITLCFKVKNNGPGLLTGVRISHPDLLQPIFIGDLAQGEEASRASDRFVTVGESVSTASVTAANAAGEGLSASDDAAVQVQELIVTIGDFVWHDISRDGVQDLDEPGLYGVIAVVWSVDSDGELIEIVGSAMTDEVGMWNLDVPAGDYRVSFVLPVGADGFSPADMGGDDTVDSDPAASGPESGFTDVVTITGQNNLDIDAGVLFPAEWFVDLDGDGFGDDEIEAVVASEAPGPEYVLEPGDCNDDDPAINPDATEIVGNFVDEDCDGEVTGDPATAVLSAGDYVVDLETGLLTVNVQLLPDPDQPLVGTQFMLTYDPAALQPVLSEDPNDGLVGAPVCSPGGCGPLFPDGTINALWIGGSGSELRTVISLDFQVVGPLGTTELGLQEIIAIDEFNVDHPITGINGSVTVIELLDWYLDADGDGFGNETEAPVVSELAPGPNYVLDNTDCADGDAGINPGVLEVPGNDVDENCDGVVLAQAFCFGLPVTIDMRTGVSGFGTNGVDVILGTPGADFIIARSGDDVICSGGGDDFINAGIGNDRVASGWGNDEVYGGHGDDDIRGGSGDDVLYGQTGLDALRGGSGIDRVFGQSGDDFLSGGADDDLLYGGIGNDVIHGNLGDDDLLGSSGNDRLIASAGADRLYGQSGDDYLSAGAGDDLLYGGSDIDRLIGGADTDTCIDAILTTMFGQCENTSILAN